MLLLLIFLLAYFMAGTPPIASLEGWAVFGIVSCVAAIAGGISEVGSKVVVQVKGEESD